FDVDVLPGVGGVLGVEGVGDDVVGEDVVDRLLGSDVRGERGCDLNGEGAGVVAAPHRRVVVRRRREDLAEVGGRVRQNIGRHLELDLEVLVVVPEVGKVVLDRLGDGLPDRGDAHATTTRSRMSGPSRNMMSGSVRAIRIATPPSVPNTAIPNGASRDLFRSLAASNPVAWVIGAGIVPHPNVPATWTAAGLFGNRMPSRRRWSSHHGFASLGLLYGQAR